ncbi:MAG TPA: VCBS repeat-containing protein [Verrucomicrobiota bacterium]|nr:VCBS repeat-containing protein [Verrucomicrobiota bacterium]HQK01982.1 VCBS repeat-containing protein [Verrucomicrobiota bacterium]
MNTKTQRGSGVDTKMLRTLVGSAFARMPLHALALAFLCMFHSGNAQVTTFTSSTFAVGDEDTGPPHVAVMDANGDGKLDLVVPHYGFRWGIPGDPGGWGSTLALLINNGTGGFSSHTTLDVGRGPCCVISADVNNDGRVDLVSVNQTDNNLTILTNGPSGFVCSSTVSAGNRPTFVRSAYVNDDCHLDLIVANAGGNNLTVLTGNGNGTFSYHATLAVGAEPLSVAVADFNGDGRTDVAAANRESHSLTIYTNNPAGTLGFSATLPVGTYPNCVMAADFDGDGSTDLVSVNWGNATMTVLTNNGSGVFGFNATLSVGEHPSTVAPADFNGDGSIDLICANTANGDGSTLTVLTNNGLGVFSFCDTLAAGRIPNVVAADLDNDGKPDLVCPNFRDGTVTVLKNTSSYPPPAGSPNLTIARVGAHVRVAWPSVSPGWSLQETAGLHTSAWLPSGYSGCGIADDGSSKSLTVPCSNKQMFFRLIHP